MTAVVRTLLKRVLPFLRPGAMLSVCMRIAAMGGKFAFILAAAVKMSSDDLGRFGFLTALCIIIGGLVGLELYQMAMRAILSEDAEGIRSKYRDFVMFSGGAAFVCAYAVLRGMGWSPAEQLLGASIVCAEYLGMELFRMLTAERRQFYAIQSFSIRSGLWSLGLPAAALVGFLSEGWSLTIVLTAWLVCSLGALMYSFALPRAYKSTSLDLRAMFGWVLSLAPHCAAWLAISLSWRFLESGGRLVAGIAVAPDVAGRFTFLSSIAVISLTVMKGLVEPIRFAELSSLESVEQRRRYAWVVTAIVTASAVASTMILGCYAVASGDKLSIDDVQTFIVLISAAAFLNFSQVPHFVLYAHRRDRQILAASIGGALIALPTAFLGAWLGGQLGLAIGLALGAVALLGLKACLAKGLDAHSASV